MGWCHNWRPFRGQIRPSDAYQARNSRLIDPAKPNAESAFFGRPRFVEDPIER